MYNSTSLPTSQSGDIDELDTIYKSAAAGKLSYADATKAIGKLYSAGKLSFTTTSNVIDKLGDIFYELNTVKSNVFNKLSTVDLFNIKQHANMNFVSTEKPGESRDIKPYVDGLATLGVTSLLSSDLEHLHPELNNLLATHGISHVTSEDYIIKDFSDPWEIDEGIPSLPTPERLDAICNKITELMEGGKK